MGALEAFIDALPDTFDVKSLLDPDVGAIESTFYNKPEVYKYYPFARRGFFAKPQVRLSPREALNDPLEMSRRWRETSADGLRNYLKSRLEITIPAIFSNTDIMISKLEENLVQRGQVLTAEQRVHFEEYLASEAGKIAVRQQLGLAQQLMHPTLDLIFSRMEVDFDAIVNEVISSSGVLSLTEDCLNAQMWAHYADQGNGFVVGFDAQHPFFFHTDGSVQRYLLKKVIYTDQHTENFWRNPYYLFLVKSAGWAYEREWRLFKSFVDSDEAVLTTTPHIHLWNIAPNAVRTIHFGYGYNESEMTADMNRLRALNENIAFYRVEVNRSAGRIEERLLL
jgi:DUF2971 family protein